MKKVRNEVFETNSSSSHSITLSRNENGEFDKKTPIVVKPYWHGGFGWEFETWNTIEEKLAYMIRCLVCYDFNEENLQDKIKPIQERLHNLGIDFELPTYEEYMNGYVDHEDWYQGEIEYIYEDNDRLLAFLLNNESCIEGGNDNELY